MTELGPNPLAAGEHNISVDEARQAIAAALVPIQGDETIPLLAAQGRILAADLISPIDVPAHDNSAMDGYAFNAGALPAGTAWTLRSVGTIYAGQPWGSPVAEGECVRIMTGAVMPEGLDTVVPLELCRVEGELVQVAPGTVKPGENRRKAGEDLARGKPALVAGRVLRPADVGLAASLGFTELRVRRRLRVALFSTGDEITAPGQPLAPGHIYDSNRFTLASALQRLQMEVIDLGLVPDDRAALQAAVDEAIERADVVLTSGGVSAGDADYTRDILRARGEVAFWKVAMRPGRPFAFGPLQAAGAAEAAGASAGRTSWLFGLPGNPVAALVTFYAFARQALLQLAGAVPADTVPPLLQARSAAAIRKRPGRTEFQRGIVYCAADGIWEVRPVGSQGAGVLRSMSEANALIVVHHGQGSVAAGEPVSVWLFDGLV
ncbi:MAG: molybdopterin molybdotransferase MoeA [Rubrivivax sp.]|jgi:molybdopterin molybdotransferase|nr:molybdopterin molybdotransferase MoeA [Rubrivivax sp.]